MKMGPIHRGFGPKLAPNYFRQRLQTLSVYLTVPQKQKMPGKILVLVHFFEAS